jgi:hypothetical protein
MLLVAVLAGEEAAAGDVGGTACGVSTGRVAMRMGSPASSVSSGNGSSVGVISNSGLGTAVSVPRKRNLNGVRVDVAGGSASGSSRYTIDRAMRIPRIEKMLIPTGKRKLRSLKGSLSMNMFPFQRKETGSPPFREHKAGL